MSASPLPLLLSLLTVSAQEVEPLDTKADGTGPPGTAGPFAPGPGLGNLTYDPADLFQPVGLVTSPQGHGNVVMLNGYLIVPWAPDGQGSVGGGFDVLDVSHPRQPVLVERIANADTDGLREPHGFGVARIHGRDLLALQAREGLQIWDFTNAREPRLTSYLHLPGIDPADYDGAWWVFWQAPYAFVAGTGAGLYVVDTTRPTDPVLVRRVDTSELAGLSPSVVFAIGNLLLLMRAQGDAFVTMDIQDPVNPKLLTSFTGAKGYSHHFAAGKILTSGGNGGPNQMFVHQVAHDGTIELVGSAGSGLGNGGYGSYQDGIFHSGFSSKYAKFDVASLTQLGTGSAGLAGSDEDFGQVLGNLVWAGNDHQQGTALIVHDTLPDSTAPAVEWVHPADGAGGVAVTSRVGLSMSDNVDHASVNANTFEIREPGGPRLPGFYSAQMGIVSFSPKRPLKTNTLYEVRASGIADLCGNTGGVFTSRFTTGSELLTPQAVVGLAALSGEPYQVGTATSGALVYIDRTFVYTALPPYLVGQPSVLTANDDKSSAHPSAFLTFELTVASDVYVLYDLRASATPAWLAGWELLPEVVGTTDVGRSVHRRAYRAGPVSLGGNLASPAAGAGSMYSVVVVPSVPLEQPPAAQIAAPLPAAAGSMVSVTAVGVTGSPPLSFVWDFGDGSPPSAPSASASATHAYAGPGRYPVKLTLSNELGATTTVATQVIHTPLPPRPPTGSGPIAIDGERLFVVHPDNDTVAAIDTTSLAKLWEVRVGGQPRTLAVAPDGNVWVVLQDADAIRVLSPHNGAAVHRVALPYGSRPYGIAFAPDGGAAFVSTQAAVAERPRHATAGPLRSSSDLWHSPALALSAAQLPQGGVLRILPSGAIDRARALSGKARGLAVSPDGSRVLVTRFVSGPDHGEVWSLDAETLETLATIPLAFDPGPDTELSGRGVPNYLSALRIHPAGAWALVPSKKDNTARGLYRDGQELTFESRTRAIVSRLDLTDGTEDLAARRDLNDRDMPQAVAFSPLGDLYIVATQGTNTLEVFDAESGERLSSLTTGRAPQGLAFTPDGARLFVHAFLDRAVHAYDTSALTSGQSNAASFLAAVQTVASESLPEEVLHGKRIFYNAADRRMNRDGYISCASCHLDGGSDGRVWDFTQVGEGLRNTTELLGRAGTAHGRVHWTANFDEIQDFENDMRGGFGGAGFLTEEQFGQSAAPLGSPKAGRSADLDALAAFVASLDRFPRSPYRNRNGGWTAAGLRGRQVFERQGCAVCHPPPLFTDLRRHDVGTLQPSSGLGAGEPLAGIGIDTPTLRGLWSSPPYLHNGAATTLEEALDPSRGGHGDTSGLTARERRELQAFLLQIETRPGQLAGAKLPGAR